MRGFLVGIAATITALLVWALLVIAGTTNGWFRDAMAPAGDTRAFMDATVSEIEADYHGNVAFLLIEDGQIFDGFTASVGRPVSIDTLFQVASLSKWVTAWGVMTLVEAGRLDLDVPVSRYLTRWALPESEFNNDGVTVRRLLSHTAGLTDGLGHNGFAPGVDVQRLEDHLTQALDAETGTSGRVHVSVEPGSEFIYSGGGFNLLQLIIEEVSGATFHEYMREAVFVPLGMSQSTYFIDDENSPNLAPFYDLDGSPATHFRFTSLGATSLYTTARDLFRFVTAHLPGSHGEPVGRGVLTAETVRLMRKPHASTMGIDVWGLGTILYSSNNEGDVIFGHDGQGGAAINTTARLNPGTGDGIVILETGDRLLATRLAGEWGFWQTGRVDFTILPQQVMIRNIVGGWLVIVAVSLFYGWRRRKAAPILTSGA